MNAKLAERLRRACADGDKAKAEAVAKSILNAGLHWVAVYWDGFWATNASWIINKADGTEGSFPHDWRVGKYDELFAN